MEMLKADAYGEMDAGDVKLMYAQFLSDQYTIYPTQSLVRNIGFDGSGTHCDETDRFNVALSNKSTFMLPDEVAVDQRIIEANQKFRAGIHTRNRILRTQALAGIALRKFKRYLKSSVNDLLPK